MHSPPSYQLPLAEASLNTTSNQTPPPNHGPILETHHPANQAIHNSPIKQKATPAPTEIKAKHTTHSTKTPHSLNHIANKFTDSLTLLRNNQQTKFSDQITTKKEILLSTLSNLASAHETRVKELTSINADLLDFDLSSTTLEFKDAAGQDKGTARLSERMKFFETRVNDVRSLIEGIVLKRESVDVEIGIVGGELRAMMVDGSEGWMEERVEEWRKRIEEVVDGAVKAWKGQESRYEREKALHREGLLKLCGEGELE